MTKKKDTRPRDKRPATIEAAVEAALRETGGVTVTGGVGLPTVVRGAAGLPMADVHVAVSPEAIDQVLNNHPAPVPAVVLPVGKRGDKGFVWELDPMWTERVERMAQVAGLSAQGYLDSLLRRAWVGLDQRHRGKL